MGRVRFALKLVVGLLVVLVLVGVGLLGVVTARGLPQTTGSLRVAGLHAAASVQRDRAGIIHITADDPHDLFVAQGYVHAQERMWQMEISRRIGAGRLSELFGASALPTDRFVRTLGWRIAAQRDLDAMSSEVRGLLDAYADGVTAWIHANQGKLGLAFLIGGVRLEDWSALDTATWQKVQAYSLGGNMEQEIFRLLADARLGDPRLTDALFPAYPEGGPVIAPTAPAPIAAAAGSGPPAAAAPGSTTLTAAHAEGLAALASIGEGVAALAGLDSAEGLVGSHGVGSNNWVVAGARTASGKPILANDPHLGYGMPSVWIMNGLHCRTVGPACPWDVAGVSFPGAPAVILGHNARIAWGATNVGPDTQDLFLEAPDPADPSRYLYKGGSVPYEVRHETIKVAGGDDVDLSVLSTVHGPVVTNIDNRLVGGPVLALRWPTIAEVDGALESFFRIDTAATFEEFRAALAGYGSPSQNFVYADVDGHIGYVLPGLVPIRAGPAPATGERVRTGDGTQDWTGYVPREQLPWQLDPQAGLVVTANNAPVDARYPFWLGRDWDPGYRAGRIRTLLEERPTGLTAADMRTIQTDTYVPRADKVVPLLTTLNLAPATADGQEILRRLLTWDHRCDVDSKGCAAYMSAELAIERAIFDRPLGPLARDYVGSTESWQATIAFLGDRRSSWWDDPSTPVHEDAAGVVAAALDRAGVELRAAYGDPARWSWARLHRVAFQDSTIGHSGIAPLEWYFNTAPRPVAGANGAINNTYYRESRAYPDPYDPDYVPVGIDRVFDVTNGPSYRLTVDMASLDDARIVITTGQSGNPFDRHYGDLVGAWAAGDTVPLPFSSAAIADAAVASLTLTP